MSMPSLAVLLVDVVVIGFYLQRRSSKHDEWDAMGALDAMMFLDLAIFLCILTCFFDQFSSIWFEITKKLILG
jgi:hypothetical protein